MLAGIQLRIEETWPSNARTPLLGPAEQLGKLVPITEDAKVSLFPKEVYLADSVQDYIIQMANSSLRQAKKNVILRFWWQMRRGAKKV